MDPDYPEGLSAADWSNIVAAHEANRHAVREVDGGGFQARNPGWGWATRFDGLGFEVEPEAGGWTFGLQLVSYGFPGDELEVTKPERVRAEGCRVVQEWDSTLEEWYVNDGRGLEHGYTVHARPGHGEGKDEGPLTIELAVRGGLTGEVERDGRSARFLDAEAAEMLRYAGLCAFDAEGRELEASMEMRGDRLLLRVDDREARYPLTIDPIVQTDYLKASNTDPTDGFGASVAISGDTVLVAAVAENSSSMGVNGNQLDNNAENSGAAYVFVRNAGVWSQQAYLKASNTDPFDHFGAAVAISGDTAIVAASGEDSASTGVNGNQSSNSADSSGAAYVFVRSGTTWTQRAYLKASNTDESDSFAYSVGISGDTAIVGAGGEDSASTGVNPDQSDNTALNAGAAYIYVLPVYFSRYCSGDPGSGTPCPCGNDNDGSVPHSGCAHGVFASGAQLSGDGVASVSQDSVVLHATHAEPNNFGLYFQGDNRVNGGDGAIFGDGLRCAGGSVVRLEARAADALGNSFTTIPLAVKGSVMPGDVKRYQFWYRNAVNSPCGTEFNLSNGLEVTWDL